MNLPSAGERDPFADWWKSSLTTEPMTLLAEAEPLRFMDLFSSVGGLTLGFSDAVRSVGRRPVPALAVDVDGGALSVYERNHRPRVAKLKSVRELVNFDWIGQGSRTRFTRAPRWKSDDLARATRGVQAIVAGPPCQGHSSLNNHSRGDDPRNLLYLTVPALAVAADVDLVVIENVPNVVHDQQSVVSSAVALLEQADYQISVAVLSAHHLGWPQTRRRFFLVATRNPQLATLPEVMAALRRDPLPVSWAISDLAGVTDAADALTFNRSSVLSEANQARVEWLFANREYDLPNDERPDCHKDGHSYPAVYGRMHADQPAGTITGGFLSPGRGRFIHPTLPRALSPHEGARIQGFPDWFEFAGLGEEPKRTQLAKWIGDAVPPILGFSAGLSALSSLPEFRVES
jgi:DNA (cytosine-5)-methyltransferase 1